MRGKSGLHVANKPIDCSCAESNHIVPSQITLCQQCSSALSVVLSCIVFAFPLFLAELTLRTRITALAQMATFENPTDSAAWLRPLLYTP